MHARCLLMTGAMAVLPGLFFLAGPRDVWAMGEIPIVAAWLGLAFACERSRRLRASVADGAITRSRAKHAILPFLLLYPVGVALASALGLAVTEAIGFPLGDMNGLLPFAFAFVAFWIAVAACALHALLVWNMPTLRA